MDALVCSDKLIKVILHINIGQEQVVLGLNIYLVVSLETTIANVRTPNPMTTI